MPPKRPLQACFNQMLDALERIKLEAEALAKDCPATNHACSKCEILHVATTALEYVK